MVGWKDVQFAMKGAKLKKVEGKKIDANYLLPEFWKDSYKRKKREDEAIFFVDTKKSYTYGEIEDFSNQVAHFFLQSGIKPGDTVAIFMENKPEYFIIWLGLAKIGGRSALINHNLKQKALVHSLDVSFSKAIIFDKDLEQHLLDVKSELDEKGLKYYCSNGNSELGPNFGEEALKMSKEQVPPENRPENTGVKIKDPVLYVYTSGTTGLPKAALVTHHRLFVVSYAFLLLFSISKKDRVYCTLPLYHSAGGIVGLGMILQANAVVVLRKKFSASQFIHDAREYKCTIVQYIGELCRYIVSTPEREDDSSHNIRLAVGNGLRADVWKRFQDRFKIPQIGEFYAATEGAVGLFNTENRFGSVGFVSPLLQPLLPIKIVKVDHETEELVRDEKGRCVPCKLGEAGELIAKIYTVKEIHSFNGYTNEKASEKKIATDVFEKGDRWFRSGDLLRMDREGFVFFVDRIGDTFRWKGENCSTAEISEIISTHLNAGEVNIYGVSIPGKDGRAGMAAIGGVDHTTFDFDGLVGYLKAQLPAYARPLFLRFLPEMEVTGTFKHKKVELRDQGFDPSTIPNPLYFLDGEKYIPLTDEVYKGIVDGTYRV